MIFEGFVYGLSNCLLLDLIDLVLAAFRLRLCYIVYPEKKKENYIVSSYLGPCMVMLLEY